MANPHRGETEITVDGKAYRLRFSIDALCLLEDKTGKSIMQLVNDLQTPENVSITILRAILWAGLREHHADVDLKAAGEMIPAAGGVLPILAGIGKALELAFPGAQGEANVTGDPPQPGRQATNGTGPASIVRGAA